MLKKNGDRIIGKHVYGNLYDIDEKKLWDEGFLRRIIKEAAELANMTLLEMKSWKIEGYHGGVSVIALVLESHIALHTWPEYNYATLDVYTCGERGDPWKAFYYIVDQLKPRDYIVHFADRSGPLRRVQRQETRA